MPNPDFPTLSDAEYARIQRAARAAVESCDPDALADVAAALSEHGVTLDVLAAAVTRKPDWHCMACGHEWADAECLDYPGDGFCPNPACGHSDDVLVIAED